MSSIYMGVAWDDVGVVNADISDMGDTRFGELSIYISVDLCNGACDV